MLGFRPGHVGFFDRDGCGGVYLSKQTAFEFASDDDEDQ